MKHPKLHLAPTWFQYETKFSPPTDLRFPAEACGSQLLTRDSGHLRGEADRWADWVPAESLIFSRSSRDELWQVISSYD